MSSKISTSHLETEDLTMLQDVLKKSGYTGKISADPSEDSNPAAKLLIKLFHEGLKDPVELADALSRNFGKPHSGPDVLPFSGLHRYAIQGVKPLGRCVH